MKIHLSPRSRYEDSSRLAEKGEVTDGTGITKKPRDLDGITHAHNWRR